jgi:Uma2 family endonuclease
MATLTQKNTPLYEGRHVTREEYLDLPDDGFRYDMIKGVLYMSPSAFFDHNEILVQIATSIRIFLNKVKMGTVVVETDVFLPDGGDVIRPDISVILKENYNIIIGHIHGVPDIVCEILSESTRLRDLNEKAGRYLKNGVKEYWIADLDKKTIELWVNENRKTWQKITGLEISSKVLTGLVLKQNDIFPTV